MVLPSGIKQFGILGGAVLLGLAVWAFELSKTVDSPPRGKARPTAQESPGRPGASGETAPVGAAAHPQTPALGLSTPLGPSPAAPSRGLVQDALRDCRIALATHDRDLGEKVYPILLAHRDLALENAKTFLHEAKDPSDHEVAVRTIKLLSLPPTHGVRRSFEW